MAMLDVFNSSPFSVTALTAAINTAPYVPGRLSEMGLFSESGITTTTASIERLGMTLQLVPVTPRGGVPIPPVRDRRNILVVQAVRLAMQDAVYADEVQNIRPFGQESGLQALSGLVNQRLAWLARKIDLTLEWHRLGALRGQVLDADATTVIMDQFATFGFTAPAEIDFDLDNATPAKGALMRKINSVIRQIEDELGAANYTEIRALCGSTFMDDLMAHSELQNTYQAVNAAQLRDRTARRTITYGGITFEEYRGKVGALTFVDDNKGLIFPVGVPDLFMTLFAPADYEETVNTVGLPRYARTGPDPSGFNRYRQLEAQSNPINLCTRPRVVIPVRRT